MQELREYCETFPHYIRYYTHSDELPTSWGMLPKRIREWQHFENLPEGIKSAVIKATDKRESETDIEYSARKQYFKDNHITLEEFVMPKNLQTSVKKEHLFTFTKNKNRETEIKHTYKISDFVHDLETKRLIISPCYGCYPIFQPNQIGHIGGCMNELDDI